MLQFHSNVCFQIHNFTYHWSYLLDGGVCVVLPFRKTGTKGDKAHGRITRHRSCPLNFNTVPDFCYKKCSWARNFHFIQKIKT